MNFRKNLPIISIFVIFLIFLLLPRYKNKKIIKNNPQAVLAPTPQATPRPIKTNSIKSVLNENYPSFLIPEDLELEYGSESGHN